MTNGNWLPEHNRCLSEEAPQAGPGSWRRLFGIQRTRQPIPGAPGAGCDGHHHNGSGIHGQHRRHTTTEVVPLVESNHRDPLGYPKLPKAAGWGRVPAGPSSGAPCPYPQRKSRVVKPHELLHKGSGIKAVFSLAPLPGRPCPRMFPEGAVLAFASFFCSDCHRVRQTVRFPRQC